MFTQMVTLNHKVILKFNWFNSRTFMTIYQMVTISNRVILMFVIVNNFLGDFKKLFVDVYWNGYHIS